MGLTAAAVIGATFAGLFSAGCAAAKDLVSKRLSFRIDGTASTFASFAFALPFYLAALAIMHALGLSRFKFSDTFLTFVILRAVTDTLAEGLKMYAFAHGDISIVATIFSISPLFLLMLSPWITGDHLSWLGLGAMLLVTVGSLVLVYRPSSADWASQKKAILLAAAASIFFAVNTCFDRLAMASEPPDARDLWAPTVAGFTMTLVSALMVAPFVLLHRARRQSLAADWRGLWGRGFLEVIFMAAKLYAIRVLKGPYVVGIMRLSVIFSIIGGWLFFREQDFRRRLAAGMLIVAGVVLIAWIQAWEEKSNALPADPPAAVSPDPLSDSP